MCEFGFRKEQISQRIVMPSHQDFHGLKKALLKYLVNQMKKLSVIKNPVASIAV